MTDCFYDCIHLQLPQEDRLEMLADAGAMRDTVADSITQELFELMQTFAHAGVEGYEWLVHHRAPADLEEAREFARRRGKESGAGQCLWADEHALQTISALADVTLCIIDEQAPSRGGRSGRVRSQDEAVDSRFVSIGEVSERVVLLHRSRRQHYSPVFLDGKGTIDVSALPLATAALWPALGVEAPPQQQHGSNGAAGGASKKRGRE